MRTRTKSYDTYIARLFYEDFIADKNNNYYVFAARSTPYDDPTTLPTIGKGVTSSFYDIQPQIVFGKRLDASDMRYMIKKHLWASDTVYDIYDDKDDTLYEKDFYVFTLEGAQYSLFKCLNNNAESRSVDPPLLSRTSYGDDLFQTGDGYVWKLMTTISENDFLKFSTDEYAPLEPISDSSSVAVDGEIDVILVENVGSNYNSFAYGTVKNPAYDDDPKKLSIQTDTETDIYEFVIINGGVFDTSANSYLFTFPANTSNEDLFSVILGFDYSANNVSANDDVQFLGEVYAHDSSVLQIDRDPTFTLNAVSIAGGENLFVVTTGFTQQNIERLLTGISKAGLGIEPEATLFSVTPASPSPQKLGDINGSGAIDSTDVTLLTAYFASGTTGNGTYDTWIASVLIPFIYANYNTYSSYLPVPFGAVTGLQIILLPELSANNNFYDNSSVYIRGGTGAGQIRTVVDYSIIGNDRVITLDEAFVTDLDSTSRYEITPKIDIVGDGSGAQAIPRATLPGGTSQAVNGIRDIQVISKGSGYTYADVTITGNTGVIDLNTGSPVAANTAVARAVIPPKGGHGSDLINEFYASGIGVSVDFTQDEHTTDNDYHMFGIILNPILREVVLEVDSTDHFTANDFVEQASSGARGYVNTISSANSTITLFDVQGIFEITDTNDDTSYIITDTANVEIVTVTPDLTKIDNRTVLDISTAVSGQEYDADEKVTQEITGAFGYVHYHDTANNILYVSGVKGSFLTGADYPIVGETSLVVADINNVTEGDIKKNTGEILYTETIQPVERSASQTERIRIVTNF